MVEPAGENAPMAPYRYIHSKVAVRDGDSVWMGSGNWKRSTFHWMEMQAIEIRGLSSTARTLLIWS